LVIDELKLFYLGDGINYVAAGCLYEQEKKCWEGVCSVERNILNRFYGAHFYGGRFNQYHRDGVYIYRRNGFFMNDQMTRELKEKFPDAKIEPKPPVDDELANPDLCYIHLFNVKPRDIETFDPYAPVSEVMVKAVCNVTEFYSEAPVRKRLEKDYGEFAEWHRHIYRFTTGLPLQGPIRRAGVVEVSPLIEMSPIECAIFDTRAKTLELMQKACLYWRCLRFRSEWNPAAVSGFSMLANGIVNAAVNGGTKIFQEVFLESDLKDDPTVKKFADQLKNVFADQLKAVSFALKIHWCVVGSEYIPLHNNIAESFVQMQAVMAPAIGAIDVAEPPLFGEIQGVR
jgi:hypothetical protein